MSDNRFYVRKHKRKEQCCSVLVTPEKPTSRRRPELKEVYGRRTRMKPEEKVFETSSNEKNTDCDKSSEIGFKTVSCVEKDLVFDTCMALSDKEELQSSDRTENSSLGSMGNLKVTLDPPGTADLKEPGSAPGLDSEVHSFDGIKNLCLESTVTSKEKEVSFNGIEVITSGDGGSICLSKSICSLENDDSFNPPSMQTDEGGSTCLVSAGTIEGLNTLDQGFNDWDSVMNCSPFEDLSCLFGPKASQPYAMSQDNGFMRENVSYDQIHANDCLGPKKRRQKPKRKIHRPKVARDGKPTTPKQARERKPKLATPKQAKEKKPSFATAKQAKEKKFKDAIKQTSLGLKDDIVEAKNPSDFESSMVIEINETKAPVARALDFRFESLDARPVKFDSLSFPIKKRRSKRRRRLNWFALSVKSGRKIVKKRNLFTANWFPRKRRMPMKRPRKVTDIDAKTNPEIHNQSDQTDLSAVREIDVLETYTLSAVKVIEQLEIDALTAVREMELFDPDTHHNTDKMDLSALREIVVLETDSETAVRQIEVLKTDTSFTGKRKRKARTLKTTTVKPREFSKIHIGLDPGRREFSIEEELDSVIHRILSLDISGNTLVPYQSLDISGSALVPYQGPFQPLKEKRPKVDLDVETVREWNLLVGIDVDRTKFGTSDDAKDQWEKDREVFAGRVASFIARLRPIQGDRSFRKWKGSVLDSTIGVILTQNVTDAYSSNAFMSVAAKFPPKPVTSESDPCCSQESVGSNMVEHDADGIQYFVTEPGPERDKELNKATDGLVGELEETRMNTGYKDCLQVISTSPNSDLNGGLVGELEETSMNTGYEGCLKVINDTNLPMSSTDNLNGACGSIVQSQYTKLPKGVRVKIPKVKERDYLNMGFGKRSTSEKKESASKEEEIDWESVRIKYSTGERSSDQMDAVDWEAVRLADVNELAACIIERGQHNILATKIQNLLNRLVTKHNCLDLEFLRNTPPDLAKRYLLEVNGLGLKSVECIRLLSLEQVAFPVDVNVARIVVRLGWVPLKPLPEHLQLHLLEQYPLLDDIQIYLWPRLCKLPQRVLYELHYHMITFGKVTCTKSKPNCKACPMSDHCRHFQSQHASATKTLPSNTMKSSSASTSSRQASSAFSSTLEDIQLLDIESLPKICEPIIEEPFEAPATPLTVSGEPEFEEAETEYDSDGIPIIKLNVKNLKENNLMFVDGKVPNALVTLHPKSVFSTAPKLKQNWRLRTEHMVYELPRNHILIQGLEQTNSEQDVQYHLAIWRPGEIANSLEPSKKQCNSTGSELCDEETCFSCNNIREQNANIVRGTLLIPCREANRSRFPLNGTYFQLNEVFADHETSYRPIVVPRELIYNLRTKTLYCGTSISAILRGEPMEVVQNCFNPGIICIRGFDQSQRAPRPLAKRFHIQPSFKVDKLKKEPKVNAKKALLQW